MIPTLASGSFFTYIHLSVLCWRVVETHCRTLRFSLWRAVLSLIFCPSCVGSPWTHSSVSSTQGVCWAPLQYLLPVPEPARKTGNSLKAISWGNCRTQIMFPISQESLSFAVLSLMSWKPLVQAFCLFFVVSERRVNPIFVTPVNRRHQVLID